MYQHVTKCVSIQSKDWELRTNSPIPQQENPRASKIKVLTVSNHVYNFIAIGFREIVSNANFESKE